MVGVCGGVAHMASHGSNGPPPYKASSFVLPNPQGPPIVLSKENHHFPFFFF